MSSRLASQAFAAPVLPDSPRSSTIVWLGDSFTGNGGGPLSPAAVASLTSGGIAFDPKLNYSRGFWVWAQNLMGQRLRTIWDAGIGGQTTGQILTRVQGDAIVAKPGWCHVLGGINDIGQNIPVATTKANLTAIWNLLDRAGIRVIAGTLGPRSSYTGSQRAQAEMLNAWIKDQGRRRKNLLVVDYHAVLAQPSGGGAGAYASGLNFDALHPNTLGAYLMGQALANALIPLLSAAPCPLLLSGEGDASNLLSQGRFGTGGNGSVIAGSWGMGLAGSPTMTYAKVARTDGVTGSWQSIAMAAGAGVAFTASHNANVGSTLAIGDTVVGCIEYQLSGLDTGNSGNPHNFLLQIQAYNGASFGLTAADLSAVDANAFPTASRAGVLLTPPITVPAGTTLMQLQVKAAGGGTFLLDRASMFNLTQLGIAA